MFTSLCTNVDYNTLNDIFGEKPTSKSTKVFWRPVAVQCRNIYQTHLKPHNEVPKKAVDLRIPGKTSIILT
jgi:hypothetical protein